MTAAGFRQEGRAMLQLDGLGYRGKTVVVIDAVTGADEGFAGGVHTEVIDPSFMTGGK